MKIFLFLLLSLPCMASVHGQREEFKTVVEESLRAPLSCERFELGETAQTQFQASLRDLGDGESFRVLFYREGSMDFSALVIYEGRTGTRGELKLSRHGEEMTYEHSLLGEGLLGRLEIRTNRTQNLRTLSYRKLDSAGAEIFRISCDPVSISP